MYFFLQNLLRDLKSLAHRFTMCSLRQGFSSRSQAKLHFQSNVFRTSVASLCTSFHDVFPRLRTRQRLASRRRSFSDDRKTYDRSATYGRTVQKKIKDNLHYKKIGDVKYEKNIRIHRKKQQSRRR